MKIVTGSNPRDITLARVPSGMVFQGKVGGYFSKTWLKKPNTGAFGFENAEHIERSDEINVTDYIPYPNAELVLKP